MERSTTYLLKVWQAAGGGFRPGDRLDVGQKGVVEAGLLLEPLGDAGTGGLSVELLTHLA